MRHLLYTFLKWMRARLAPPVVEDLKGNTTSSMRTNPHAAKLRAECRLRVPLRLLEQMQADLRRPHAFAHERVGMMLAREAEGHGERLILAHSYVPLRDDEYVEDTRVGARINREAIRRMLTLALAGESVFHVHLHEHADMPGFSQVDEENLRELLPSFCSAGPQSIHGALLLSDNCGRAWGWKAGHDGPIPFSSITIVGSPLRRWEVSS